MMKKQNAVKYLSKQSEQVVSVIYKLISQLKDTNEKIEEEKAMNVARIKAIENDQASLSALRDSNAKILANFEGLVG